MNRFTAHRLNHSLFKYINYIYHVLCTIQTIVMLYGPYNCILEPGTRPQVHFVLFRFCSVCLSPKYCKSTNFGVLLHLANLANCVYSLIFVTANIRN